MVGNREILNHKQIHYKKQKKTHFFLSLIGIILRWGFLIWELIFLFFIYCGLFVLILVDFCVVSSSLCFGQISPLAFFRWLTATSNRNAESCNRIPNTVPGEHCQKIAVSIPTQAGQRFTWSKMWCDRQQLWKAVITGDTVTRLSIPIQGHS